MQLVLKVSKIISWTSWRTLSLCGVLCWLILFSWHVSFITRVYLVPEVFLLVKKGLLRIFTDCINPKVSILLRPAVSSKILVHVLSAELLGGLRPVSPQPCKRSHVETDCVSLVCKIIPPSKNLFHELLLSEVTKHSWGTGSSISGLCHTQLYSTC